MARYYFLIPFLAALTSALIAAQAGHNYGQFAPPDAYSHGGRFAYYGSENPWDRRFFSASSADRFYKRRGQRQLLAILDGHADQAAAWCRRRLAGDANDAESLFMLTVAQCQLGQPDQALQTMKRALAAGLPPGRFLAGPRRLLAPLTATKTFRDFAAGHRLRLIHGPLLGAVTDHSARFWVRTTAAMPVTIRVFSGRASKAAVASATGRTTKEKDYTAVIEVTGLRPATRYHYDVLVDGQAALGGHGATFRTYPTKGTSGRFRVGFGGGAGYTPQHESIWETIASLDLSAFLLLGDNVYIDLPEEPGPFHRYTYYRRQSRPEFRRLVRSTPIYAIWDDHDAAIDDVWLGPYVNRPAWKLPQLALFKQNWNNPDAGDAKYPGCWFQLSIGDVDFFLLDCRFYRTNPFAKNPTMLGRVQKTWLLERLRKSHATFKAIVSSVPWAPDAKPGSRDTWDGFPDERRELFSWLAASHIDGVLLLSADRHRSDAWRVDRPDGYPLYDLMSSRLTNIHRHQCMKRALFSYNERCSFGLLTFDTTRPDPEVTYQIINIDGTKVYSLRLRKSRLTTK